MVFDALGSRHFRRVAIVPQKRTRWIGTVTDRTGITHADKAMRQGAGREIASRSDRRNPIQRALVDYLIHGSQFPRANQALAKINPGLKVSREYLSRSQPR